MNFEKKLKAAAEEVCIKYDLAKSKARGDGSGIFDITVDDSTFEFAHQCVLAGMRETKQEIGFQPIETAPKDGSKILLLFKSEEIEQAEWIEYDLEVREGWRSIITVDYIEDCHVDPPIAWMKPETKGGSDG